MPDQETIEQVQQEVHTPNHVRKFEQEKKAKELEATEQSVRDGSPQITNQELQISHHNHHLESKINPTLEDYINVKHKSLFERLKGLFR